MTDAKRIAKLEAQVASLRSRLAARTDQLLLLLLQIEDLKAGRGLVEEIVAPDDLSQVTDAPVHNPAQPIRATPAPRS